MSDGSAIEWTDATWNPITGCTLVSDGCRHCYAAELATTRLRNHPSRAGLARKNAAGEAKFTGEVRINKQWLDQPLRWKRPRRIFVCAHSDLFHEAVPDGWIDQVFAVMALAPQHTFQVLTKRPARAQEYLTADGGFGPWGRVEHHARHMAHIPAGKTLATYGGSNLPHIWLGTSVEDQAAADARIPHLLAAPAAIRFLSAEPLLGPLSLEPWLAWPDGGCELPDGRYFGCASCDGEAPGCKCPRDRAYYTCDEGPRDATGCPEWVHAERITLDWVIVGGESGRGARPMHPDWARSLRDQCAAASVPFLFKQWGSWAPISELGESDDLYHPAPERHPEASRRCRVANLVMHASGSTFDRVPGGAYHGCTTAGAFAAGAKAMLMFEVGKARAGRLLDGREHNGFPR